VQRKDADNYPLETLDAAYRGGDETPRWSAKIGIGWRVLWRRGAA
jgi:hypothetical protein